MLRGALAGRERPGGAYPAEWPGGPAACCCRGGPTKLVTIPTGLVTIPTMLVTVLVLANASVWRGRGL